MNRRELLTLVSTIIGGSVIGGAAFLEGCSPTEKKSASFPLTPEQIAFLDEIAETIIPTTDTPGAKAAKVGAFMNVYVTDCYDEIDQLTFVEGLNDIEAQSKKKFNTAFMQLNATQKKELLTSIDAIAKNFKVDEAPKADPLKVEVKKVSKHHYFKMMKQLTIMGYFTSEIGATQALRHVAVPGRYEGTVDYKKGDRLWSA